MFLLKSRSLPAASVKKQGNGFGSGSHRAPAPKRLLLPNQFFFGFSGILTFDGKVKLFCLNTTPKTPFSNAD